MPRPATTDARALRHPLWWAALGLLVVNDHVLKGSGLLDGALTGKLSDVAGLIVAPVLLSALLGARGPRRRGIAFVAVGGWFAAANLVGPVASATASAGALIGLSWSFVADPTDLVALGVLPLAWHVAAHRGPLAPRAWVERTAAGFGVAACLASPTPDPQWQTDAYLVNRTGRAVEVRVRWVDVSMDCGAVRERPEAILARDAFAPGTSFRLEIDETLPLNRELRGAGSDDGLGRPRRDDFTDAGPTAPWRPSHEGDCDAALLSVDGLMNEQLVFWEGLALTNIPIVVEDDEDERAVEGGLQLYADDEDESVLTLGAPRPYQVTTPDDRYAGGTDCRDYGTITGFDWSDLPPWSGEEVRLTEVRPTVDDCVSVTFEPVVTGEAVSAFLCVPPADFPFLANSVVDVYVSPQQLRIVRDLRLDDGSLWRTGELLVVRGVGALSEGPFDLELVQVDDACGGVRMDCGGFRVPAAGGLALTDGTRFVHPGDVVERTGSDGRLARLRVGRAERMLATHPACGAGRDSIGPRLEALVTYGEEPR